MSQADLRGSSASPASSHDPYALPPLEYSHPTSPYNNDIQCSVDHLTSRFESRISQIRTELKSFIKDAVMEAMQQTPNSQAGTPAATPTSAPRMPVGTMYFHAAAPHHPPTATTSVPQQNVITIAHQPTHVNVNGTPMTVTSLTPVPMYTNLAAPYTSAYAPHTTGTAPQQIAYPTPSPSPSAFQYTQNHSHMMPHASHTPTVMVRTFAQVDGARSGTPDSVATNDSDWQGQPWWFGSEADGKQSPLGEVREDGRGTPLSLSMSPQTQTFVPVQSHDMNTEAMHLHGMQHPRSHSTNINDIEDEKLCRDVSPRSKGDNMLVSDPLGFHSQSTDEAWADDEPEEWMNAAPTPVSSVTTLSDMTYGRNTSLPNLSPPGPLDGRGSPLMAASFGCDSPTSPQFGNPFQRNESFRTLNSTNAAALNNLVNRARFQARTPTSNGQRNYASMTTVRGVETDQKRLEQRRKQIDLGKATPGYANYLSVKPKEKRTAGDPATPRVDQLCSKRSFDAQIRRWRRSLHAFDDAMPDDDGVPSSPRSVDSQNSMNMQMRHFSDSMDMTSSINALATITA